MNHAIRKTIPADLTAGLVVFLVALPLCLGVALASGAPLFSGILAGIVGGIVVGLLSGSSTSVSGPAAGLTAVVAGQIAALGSFEAFLTAVVIAGAMQIVMSLLRLGFIAAFFPSSVIKGLLWAIGAILILKQFPHVLGHDVDPMGNDAFLQPDHENTFSELGLSFFHIHAPAAFIGLLSMGLLVAWEKWEPLKRTSIPGPVVVVVLSVALAYLFKMVDPAWAIGPAHLVQVPVAETFASTLDFLYFPDLSVLTSSQVFVSALTIALVASLETLLNLEALDKIDPRQRYSPPNRELLAQGIGNMTAGFIGAIPLTSVIVRSSVNINAGVRTKFSTIWHGLLLLGSVLFIPTWLNQIPLSALAAILLITGLKLASPQTFMQMWKEGKNQFLPFVLTVIAIVLTDPLIGVLIGLTIAVGFILHSNIRRPIKKTMEKQISGEEVLHIELPNQVSFFNKASLEGTLKSIQPGGHVLIDASNTDYIDPDILDLIMDFQRTGTGHEVVVSLVGFKDRYPQLEDKIQYLDVTTRETQENLTPAQVLEILRQGNIRFREGVRLTRQLDRQLNALSVGQFPMAAVLSCIDSRNPAELIFDLSMGDIFSVRIAGNVISRKVLGSLEYCCAVAGSKLILVMGHTSCGAVKSSVDLICKNTTAAEATGCKNLDYLVTEIQKSVNPNDCKNLAFMNDEQKEYYFNEVCYKNVLHSMKEIRRNSPILNQMIEEGKIGLVGAVYNISTAEVSFFEAPPASSKPANKFLKIFK